MRLRSKKAPQGGTGQGLNSAENGDPFNCSSGRRGRCAKRGALSASPLSADFKPLTRMFRPVVPAGTAASSTRN
eukprot:7293750-Alexandrium_andersonii.AAC.1